MLGHLLGLGDHLRGVQERLRRDAPDVEADPAEGVAGVDHQRLDAEVGGPERGGVPAGSGAEDEQPDVAVLGAVLRRRRRAGPGGGGRRSVRVRRRRGLVDLRRDLASSAAGCRSAASDADGVRTRIGVPCEIRSPIATRSSVTVPAVSAGMSIVALSDSMVSSGSSRETSLPAVTWISMTGTSVKSPMSGTSTTTGSATRVPFGSEGWRTARGTNPCPDTDQCSRLERTQSSRRRSSPMVCARCRVKRAARAPSIDAVVVGQAQRQQVAGLELRAVPHRRHPRAHHPEDRDLGGVDDRGERRAADPAERGDREGAARACRRRRACRRGRGRRPPRAPWRSRRCPCGRRRGSPAPRARRACRPRPRGGSSA